MLMVILLLAMLMMMGKWAMGCGHYTIFDGNRDFGSPFSKLLYRRKTIHNTYLNVMDKKTKNLCVQCYTVRSCIL